MPVVVFLGLTGFVAVAATTATAILFIYGVVNGFSSADELLDLVGSWVSGWNEKALVIGAIVIAWAVASIPGFLLLANSLNTENQMLQLEAEKKAGKELAEVLKSLSEIQRLTANSNQYLALIAKDKN